MPALPRVVVREMQIAEVGLRIDYFHDSSDEHLQMLGVDRASLLERWGVAASPERAPYRSPERAAQSELPVGSGG